LREEGGGRSTNKILETCLPFYFPTEFGKGGREVAKKRGGGRVNFLSALLFHFNDETRGGGEEKRRGGPIGTRILSPQGGGKERRKKSTLSRPEVWAFTRGGKKGRKKGRKGKGGKKEGGGVCFLPPCLPFVV